MIAEPATEVRSPELRRGGRRMMFRATKRAGWWIPLGLVGSLLWVGAKILVPLAARRRHRRRLRAVRQQRDREVVRGDPRAQRCVAAPVPGSAGTARSTSRHRTEHVLRSQLFAHLQELHFGYHDRAQIGNLMARANLDLRQINQLVVFVPVFAANVVMVVAILAVLFTLNVKLTLLSVISFPLLAVGAAWFQKLLDPVADPPAGTARRGVGGRRGRRGRYPRASRGSAPSRWRRSGSTGAPSRCAREAVALGRLRATFNPLLDLLPMVALVTVLYVGGKDAIDGSLTVGDLVAFSALLLQLVFPLRMTSYVVAQIVARVGVGRAGAGSDGDRAGDRRRRVGARSAAGPGRGVVLGRVVRVPRRATTCCATSTSRSPAASRSRWSGPPGAARAPWRGSSRASTTSPPAAVCIDGHDVRDVRLGSLRREIGLVFEETFLFSDTVWENLAFAARRR